MGEVYRATDTKLGRGVALKLLPEAFAADPERLERFQREAKALAALDHPGIVTVYSVEESGGVHFLTMQLVEGQPLDRLIPESGLPVERILEIATALAEALAAAHEKGIVHRDLKPTNVMVTKDGKVKVLDFGLAKVAGSGEGAGTDSALSTEMRTREGVVMGTMPYMSPEQVQGQALDHRSDIFSLGIILYEMACGERPFQGRSSAGLASAILRDAPRSLGERRKGLPQRLTRVIERCLEKGVRDRFASAPDLRDELRGVTGEAAQAQAPGTPLSRPAAELPSGAARQNEGFWVAVRPFKYTGANAELTALAEGLSEEIVTGLSRFSYLRVIARSSAPGPEARYLIEGSLRQAGTKVRAAVQLVDTTTGAHLWAENYERSFSPEAVFELQDDLVPRIVSTVADMHGILPRGMSETVRLKAAHQLTPYEALLHSFGYNERFTPESLAEARTCLERAVEQSPGNADCWAMLSLMYSNEYGHWDIQNPGSFEKALRAARTAVQAAPLHSLPYYALAQALFFQREFPASRVSAERAVSLNPMDGATAAFMGLLIAYSGDWERGCALAERGLQLNPNLPGMYYYTAWHDAYGKKDYRRALNLALKLNTPDSFYQHAVLAMCYAQLGEMDAADKSLRDMLALKPDYGRVARQLHGKWIQPDLVEQLMDGLRKAGLVIGEPAAVDAAGGRAADPSEGVVSAETKSIVVLPFANLSPDPDTEYFSDGLTDEIITDLSRVRALRVISRSSAMRLKGDGRGLSAIGRDLACRYVLEGSVRRAANSLRITARLVDAPNDAQLWADKYRGTLDDVFDIQERVSRSIVDALEIRLTPQEAAQLAERPIADVRAQDSYLRARSEIWSFMPDGLDRAISHLEAALRLIGDNALLYQGLGEAYFQYINIGVAGGREEEYIKKAESCAEKIFALEPESPRGYLARAPIQLARGDIHGCGRSLRRVLQEFPKDILALQLYTHVLGWLGGKPDAAAPLAARLADADPLNAMSLLMSAMVPLFAGRFREALEPARRMFALDPVTPVWRANYVMALSYNQRLDEAEALTEGVAAQPDSDVGTWWMGLCRAAWRADRAEVLRLADGPYQQAAAWDAEIPWLLASAHAAVGATEQALVWLNRAIDRGMINYPFLSEHDRSLDSVRGDARFGQAMERARREWERFEV